MEKIININKAKIIASERDFAVKITIKKLKMTADRLKDHPDIPEIAAIRQRIVGQYHDLAHKYLKECDRSLTWI